jgi:TIR domain
MKFDLFVVFAEPDERFVHGFLLPAIGLPGERVHLIDNLTPGELYVAEIERGVAQSRFTVVVLSPAYLRDRWAVYGEQLASSLNADHAGVVPLLLADCPVPLRMESRVPLDFRDEGRWHREVGRLRDLLAGRRSTEMTGIVAGRGPDGPQRLEPASPDGEAAVRAPAAQPDPQIRRRPPWRWLLLAPIAAVGAVAVATWWHTPAQDGSMDATPRVPNEAGARAIEPLLDWLYEDFMPTVHEVNRLAMDLGTASGHYLAKNPSSQAAFREQVDDVRFVTAAYNGAFERFRARSERYRANLEALGDRDRRVRDAAAALLEYAEYAFTEQALPAIDPNRSIGEQHQALAERWRGYEQRTSGAFQRVAEGERRLEREVVRAAGFQPPECPPALVAPKAALAVATTPGSALATDIEALRAYARALRDLEQATLAFTEATIPDTATLRAASKPLKAAISRNNDAYRDISNRRLALTLELASTLSPSEFVPAACALDRIEAYQLNQLSPMLNDVLVDVVAGWRDQASEALLAEVRLAQRTRWGEVAETLRLGADAFAVFGPAHACAACDQ